MRTSPLLLLKAALLAAALCWSGCSDSSEPKQPQNTISPYDTEFDPEDTSAESDLPEEELLDRAKNAYDNGLYTVARENWNKLRENYPSSYYATLAELKIADSYYYAGDYATAVTAYEEFIKLHAAHDAIPYVRLQIGNAHREQYSGVLHDSGPLVAAMKSYRKLIEDYPKSDLVLQAREQIAVCRELLGEHELEIANFYGKQGHPQARLKRLEVLRKEYPETEAAREAASDLSESPPGTPTLIAKNSKSAAQKPDGPQHGTKPAVPELLASSGEQRDSGVDARFRMLQPDRVSESSIDLTSTKNAARGGPANSDAVRSEPNFLNCKEENNMQIFTAQFSKDLVLVGRASGDSNAFVLRERNSAMPKLQGDGLLAKRVVKECETDTAGIRFFAVENSDSVYVAKLEKSSASGAVHAFTLDRPSRFIVILEK